MCIDETQSKSSAEMTSEGNAISDPKTPVEEQISRGYGTVVDVAACAEDKPELEVTRKIKMTRGDPPPDQEPSSARRFIELGGAVNTSADIWRVVRRSPLRAVAPCCSSDVNEVIHKLKFTGTDRDTQSPQQSSTIGTKRGYDSWTCVLGQDQDQFRQMAGAPRASSGVVYSWTLILRVVVHMCGIGADGKMEGTDACERGQRAGSLYNQWGRLEGGLVEAVEEK
ncbi:hypothetical protein HETIRDRAFT_444187, partial [Heterobasidion irregulare TC 32-1]